MWQHSNAYKSFLLRKAETMPFKDHPNERKLLVFEKTRIGRRLHLLSTISDGPSAL